MDIDYSDGDSAEAKVLGLLRQEADVSAGATPAIGHYGDWPTEYHLCPERSHLLRPFDFSGLDVLELGAGMGAVSRLIAEKARHLTVVEGTSRRYAALSERLKGLTNWDGWVGNIQDFTSDRKYDVVCVIGVLEYSELFVETGNGKTAHEIFLERASSFLKPAGVLILAIENRLGLKYWTGLGEDHLGKRFEGIAGYATSKTPRTFSRLELKSLFEKVGLLSIQEYFPYPDYKIPSSVLSLELLRDFPRVAAAIASAKSSRDYLNPSNRSEFPELLAIEGIADATLLPEFANSFLFLGSRVPSSPVMSQVCSRQLSEKELGWHFSSRLRHPTRTTFRRTEDALVVDKTLRDRSDLRVSFRDEFEWAGALSAPVQSPPHWIPMWARNVYYGKVNVAREMLVRFLRWSLQQWSVGGPDQMLRGEAIDALVINTAVNGEGFPTGHFDLEWSSTKPIRSSYFIFRNCLALWNFRPFLESFLKGSSLGALYSELCHDLNVTPNFEADLALEMRFQSLVNQVPAAQQHAHDLRSAFALRFSGPGFRRDGARPRLMARVKGRLKRQLKQTFPKLVPSCVGFLSRTKAFLSRKILLDYTQSLGETR